MPTHDQMVAAVHGYVNAFANNDPAAVAALFAPDATVEDPIGSPQHKGHDAILAFYTESMKTGAKLTLEGPIRTAGDYAAFAFSVSLAFKDTARIDVIDTFRFNEDGKVVEMRAYFGPNNMQGM
ncbi:nuclear transport factor 2 family protein [Sphingomonas sp. KC8]|uniref:nuclear transport factor 2 family protein n=1 Tax=Sphingomonas sp. KC8 TaxID=1030157 RepID=UPI0002DF0C80|nr:nuclear transport factor 2 family protein [Sphingomonas sp. KC8]ARS25876.1 steroid delta-isomerase [Sphingomonas sp. KC8]